MKMTIQECREKDCIHVSNIRNCRNCCVMDCLRYGDVFEKRWMDEEDWEFEDYEDEDV